MWPHREEMFVLVDSNAAPILVKFDDTVSYMPVFESKDAAASAARSLKNPTKDAVQKSEGEYQTREFSWAFFRQWKQTLDKTGIMLFVYPMSPSDYGS